MICVGVRQGSTRVTVTNDEAKRKNAHTDHIKPFVSACCLSICDDGALLQATLSSCSIPHYAFSRHPLTVITTCLNATGSLGEKIKLCAIWSNLECGDPRGKK